MLARQSTFHKHVPPIVNYYWTVVLSDFDGLHRGPCRTTSDYGVKPGIRNIHIPPGTASDVTSSCIHWSQPKVAQQGAIDNRNQKKNHMMAWSEGGVSWCDVGRGRSARQQVSK
jgi:hypothetical protein